MFRMNGYVQDERYTAGAGRAGAVPFKLAQCLSQDAQERCLSVLHGVWHKDVRRDCVKSAQRFLISMGAEVARYLSSGLARVHPCIARSRHPCRSRS